MTYCEGGVFILSSVLRELLHERGMSIQECAEKADVPMETMRNIYYGKVKDPKVSTLMSISRVFQVSVNYLMGESLYTPEEQLLIRNYRKCGVHGKSIVSLVSRYEANTARREREADKHKIPCMVPAGRIQDGFTYSNHEVVEIHTANEDAYAAIEITGNAYAPVYCKGDRVLIADRYPENGERGVFVRDGAGYIRQFMEKEDAYVLKSLSRHQPDLVLKRLGDMECIGTCIGVIMA